MGAQDLFESPLPGQNLCSVSGSSEDDSLLSFHLVPWHETSALQTRAWWLGCDQDPSVLGFPCLRQSLCCTSRI